ncbi:sulfatase [Altericroceibacterium endophyticum]|uniref:Sulfatase-like hydrolase/transferase n=1 Tax=Altericroceibacterium endophyticum TaxID=1808508 RepID=A0A6I4T4F2_9SPHN|nr:sulfatase [Altericroceibacterium endophyticum]MXO64943.1 sulfatase-like hydrolase/transferase [Altericroceibacterium endophyticum]
MGGFSIDRRSAIVGAGGAVLSGLASAQAAARAGGGTSGSASRPNILWLVSEDNNPFIGAYGDKIAHTPNIDRLAREGVLYRNAYSNAPVCAPTRFAILTGIYPESCGPAHQMRAKAHLPSQLRTYPEHLRSAGYFCSNNHKTDYNCDVEPERIWSDQGKTAHWRDRPDRNQPFMSVFNYMTTHESRLLTPVTGRVGPEDVRVPRYLPDTDGIRGDYATYYNLMEKMDAQVGQQLAELEEDGLDEDTIVFYYSDNGGSLPRSKRYCYDEGLRCALIVRFPEKWKHLAPGAPGSEVRAPVSFVDLVPTVLSLAGLAVPGTMQGSAFLGESAKAAQPYAFGMRNRMDERYDFVRTVTDGRYRYIRNYLPHLPAVQYQAFAWLARGYQDWDRAFRAGRLDALQSRAFEPRPAIEFYDLESDPDQLSNLAEDPGQQGRISEMSAALDAHMLRINDNGFIPEGLGLMGWAESRVPGAYPLQDIMQLAAMAAQGDPANLVLLGENMEHDHPVMRYWAAKGCAILGAAARANEERILTVMRGDDVPQLRVAAAEAAARIGHEEEAADILGALMAQSECEWVRLQAINVLTLMGEAARPALPEIKAAAESDTVYYRNAARYLSAVLDGTYDPAMEIFEWDRIMKHPKPGGE